MNEEWRPGVTTKAEIKSWLEEGKAAGATHVIVVCDTFDWEDYPVFVSPHEDPRAVYDRYDDKNMQKVMEVYNTAMDLDAQLAEDRAWHFEAQ